MRIAEVTKCGPRLSLVRLAGRVFPALWSQARARKEGVCAVTGRTYSKGIYVWRPCNNGHDRAARVIEMGVTP